MLSHSLAKQRWRTFNFFNLASLQQDNNDDKASILQGIDILEWAPGDGFVLFAEPKGAMFHLTKELDVRFFKAFQQRLIHFTHSHDILVAIGIDDVVDDGAASSSSAIDGIPTLKIWDLKKWDEAIAPKCKFSCQLNFGRKVDVGQASVVAVSDKLNLIVVGLSNSSMFYALTDLCQERSMSAKWMPLRESSNPIKDGQLAGVAIGTHKGHTIVACVTDKTVHSYVLNSAGMLTKTIVHDVKGCERKCWYFSRTSNRLIVAGKEMVYFYDLKDCLEMGGENGRCHALERGSEKVQMLEREGQIALLTEKEAHIQSTSSKNAMTNMLSLYDIESRYIAFFCSMPAPCRVFTLDEEIYLLNAEGVLSKLVEESTEKKLEMLLRNNLFEFDLAISIARRSKSDELIKGIYLKYGDYLYSKCDFENAIKQYINTIRFVEPSNIIKKFFDGPRIVQLCQYLEALRAENLANGHHLTLLFSVYVKLDEVDKLEALLDNDTELLTRTEFDIDSSIKLLRSAQLHHIASKLALKCDRPHIFLEILCQDTHQWERALRFIEKLPPQMACDFLEVHGPVLLENHEEKTLELIKRQLLCSEGTKFKQLTKALMSKPRRMEELFREINLSGELKDPQVRNVLLEQHLRNLYEAENLPSKEQFKEMLSLLDADNFEYALLKAQQYNCLPLSIHILRALNRTEELFRCMLKEGDLVGAVELCESKSLQDMWIELISYGTTRKNPSKKEDLLALLNKVSKSRHLINPLVVLELLSRDESLQVGDIRDFIIEWLGRQNAALRATEQTIEEQEKQLAEMNKEIEDLENNVQVYQVAKCTVCSNPLHVPAIHFLCRHSYHANCFESYSGNRPDECPACAVAESKERQSGEEQFEEETAEDKRKHKEATKMNNYQQFKNELARSTDVMALISDCLASGKFSHLSSSASADSQQRKINEPYNPFEED